MDTRTALQRLEFMGEALNALRYLDTLMDVALNADGGILSDPHSGLHYLMKAHLETLDDGVDLLRDFVKRAEQAHVPASQPGIGHELHADAVATAAAERLRSLALETVARDTNLKEETVRRVVERLMAEPGEAMGKVAR